jgi:hypothetical protein
MGIAAYMYNKPHKNIAVTSPDYSLSSATLYQEFEESEPMANERYLNKVVAVNGKLTIHGITKPVTPQGTIEVKEGQVLVQDDFMDMLEAAQDKVIQSQKPLSKAAV